jgi:hypothetical protein
MPENSSLGGNIILGIRRKLFQKHFLLFLSLHLTHIQNIPSLDDLFI